MADLRPVDLIDVTIRDAHQSLWATRMTAEMIAPIAPTMDEVGFAAIDIMGGAGFDVCVRFLGEDPWWRIEALRELLPATPINVWLRGQSLFTFELFPDDVVEATINSLAARGVDRLTTFDPLNDLRNIELSVRTAKQAGMHVTGGLAFTYSPVHTDAFYVTKTRELVGMGVDAVLIKDATGVLTPERCSVLVRAVRSELPPGMELQVHSHCRSGLAPHSYLQAMEAGATALHTASRPLANGASLPASEFAVKNAIRVGCATSVEVEPLAAMASYFQELARRHGKPLGEVAEYDPAIFEHQIPGGMISNLESQLREMGISHRFGDIVAEVAQVREDLGYPVVVSPFAQFVVTQATLNVIAGERYRTIPEELKKYAQGYYGQPAGPLAPEFLEKAVAGRNPVNGRSGDNLPLILEEARRRNKSARIEDILLAVFYKDEVLNRLKARREETAQRFRERGCHNSLVQLAHGIAQRPDIVYADVTVGSGTLRIRR